MKTKTIFRAAILGLSFTALLAQEGSTHKVEQKNRGFSVTELTVRRGAKVEFCNSDDVTHNVFSKSSANAFNIKTQMPGNSSIVEFKEAGVTEIRCAIHPAMKLIITVRE